MPLVSSTNMTPLRTTFVSACLLLASSVALAGEADDLQRMIDSARQGMKDLQGLDEHGAVRDDLTLLDVWLKEAWNLRAAQKYDEVRVVLDRCQAQSEMIRQAIATSKVVAEAKAREAELAKVRADIAKTREALRATTLKRATLEGKGK
jgi:hypothetical protein